MAGVTLPCVGTGSTTPVVNCVQQTDNSFRQVISLGDRYDYASIDSFSRLRASLPIELFSSQNQYNADPLLIETGATGSFGTAPSWSSNTRMINLQTTSGSGASTSFLQSYTYAPYAAGRSQLIFATFVMGAAISGAQCDIGYFDSANGVIFRQDTSGGLNFVLRTSTSGSVSDANAVAQASWNIDTLQGSGPSGYTLDISKSQILVIDLQYLAMGRVRCGFDIGGNVIWAHQFLNANTTLAVPYMQTATLPVGMLVSVPTSSGSTKNAYFKCASVLTEGADLDSTPERYTFSTPLVTTTAGSGTRTHCVSIRPLTTFNSIANRSLFQLALLEIIAGANPVFWELCVGQALTGASYTSYNATYSAFEYAANQTLSGSPAIVIASGLLYQHESLSAAIAPPLAYPITLNRAGAVRDLGTLTLLLTGLTGTSVSYASVTHQETR